MITNKCAGVNCHHKTITNHELCSICRVKNRPRHNCAYVSNDGVRCENLCMTEFCRLHAHKLIQCEYIKSDGSRCVHMGRGNLCCRHTEKSKIMRSKFRNKYRKYDPIKTRLQNRKKRINELNKQIDDLKLGIINDKDIKLEKLNRKLEELNSDVLRDNDIILQRLNSDVKNSSIEEVSIDLSVLN